ncbi:hypothetical protein FNV43_RR25750 [Rhamnella rubrinervis]|uniref:Uncharacterized protein n=1 Tax=Rhamnella rubrinervis TaxID=2594499 RepID=A0A8K0GQU2_9ROSA|nr:hypothetical protein FNV43_RR25750 [Rhamnella rubrinervis]
MGEMSEKEVGYNSTLVLVVAVVLMVNFVSCENMNDDHAGFYHHHHGNDMRESYDLAPHNHHDHNGNRKMDAGGVIVDPKKYTRCAGQTCSQIDDDCAGGPNAILFLGDTYFKLPNIVSVVRFELFVLLFYIVNLY